MNNTRTTKAMLVTACLVLGGALFLGSTPGLAATDESGAPAYGPGMMGRYPAAQGGGYGRGYMPGYAGGGWGGYGPGTGYGCGAGHWGGYGPGMMYGYGGGRWGGYGAGMMYGYGPGMMLGYGPGMMLGYGGGYGPGMMRRFGWGAGFAGMQLTDLQRKQLFDIQTKAVKEAWTLMGQMREEHLALSRLLLSGNPDRKAVNTAYDKLSGTGRQLLDLRIRTRSEALAVLTAEQRKQLEELGGSPAP